MSACVCPAASEERGWAPLPASSRAESRPPSPSAGTRGKPTGAPTRRSGLIASSSPPQESGSAPRLGSRPGVGPPSGYCTADRGASAASPASRDPLGKASGQMTVAVRTPRMGAERGPSPLQSWPTVRKGLPVCFLIPLHPRRQVRLLQTQMQPWRRAGPEPGQWASLWRRRPRVPSPNPDPAFWTGC